MDDKLKQVLFGKPHFRVMASRAGEVNAETRTIPMSFSSEHPVLRWWGVEILSHEPDAVKLDRAANGLAFLDMHNPMRQGGRVEGITLADKVVRGNVRFAKTPVGDELYSLHSDRIRLETSSGYNYLTAKELKPEEMSAEVRAMCLEYSVPAYLITGWEPLEESSVSIAADPTVGQERSLEYYDDIRAFQMVAEGRSFDLQSLIPEDRRAGSGIPSTITDKGDRIMDPIVVAPATPAAPESQITAAQVREQATADERTRRNEIEQMRSGLVGRISNINELAEDAVKTGMPVSDFRGVICMAVRDSKPIFEDPNLGLTDTESKTYSITRFISAAGQGKRDLAPFEFECSDAIERSIEKGSNGRALPEAGAKQVRIFIPYEVMHRRNLVTREQLQFAQMNGMGKRTLSVGTAAGAGYLKATEFLANQFVEYPRPETLFETLGCRILTGLKGDVTIPKKTGRSTFAWLTNEGDNAGNSELAVGSLTMSPKIGGHYSDYTLKLLLQATPEIDALVQEDLLESAQIGIDLACFHGTGANGQPRGIANQVGVGTFSAVDFGLDAAIEAITDVWAANLLTGSLSWVTNPTGWGIGRKRPVLPGIGAERLISQQNIMEGFPVAVTNQIAASNLMFGAWNQALCGYWAGYMLLVDQFALALSGGTRVHIKAACDVAVRNALAFSVATDMS